MARPAPLPNPGKAKPLKSIDLVDFTGGVNARKDAFGLAPNEVRDAVNVDFQPDGGFKLRNVARFNIVDSVNAGQNQGFYSQTYNRILTAASNSGNDILSASPTATSWDTVTNGPANSNGGVIRYRSAELNATTYFVNGAGLSAGRKWTGGSSMTLMSTPGTGAWQDDFASPSGAHLPGGRFFASHNHMLWVGYPTENHSGAITYPYRVRWSHPGDGGSWRRYDYIDITDGGALMGLQPLNDVMLVLTQRGIYAISGYDADTFAVSKISELGVLNELGVCSSEIGVFFVDRQGRIMLIDRNFQIRHISERIDRFWEQDEDTFLLGQLTESWDLQFGGYHRKRLWVSLRGNMPTPLGTTVNVATWDPELDCWSFYYIENLGSKILLSTRFGMFAVGGADLMQLDVPHLGLSSVHADEAPDGSDVHIDAHVTTRWVGQEDPTRKKTWKRPEVIYKADDECTFTVTSYRDYDYSSPVKTMTMSNVGTDVDYEVDRLQSLGPARAQSLKIAGPTDVDTDWTVDAVTLKYRSKPLRN